jgi:hypothetical protein
MGKKTHKYRIVVKLYFGFVWNFVSMVVSVFVLIRRQCCAGEGNTEFHCRLPNCSGGIQVSLIWGKISGVVLLGIVSRLPYFPTCFCPEIREKYSIYFTICLILSRRLVEQAIMMDPVILLDTGVSYERQAVEEWLGTKR